MSMTEYGTLLQTVAAVGSAVAAIAAFCIARNTYLFQKNSLLKKASIEQILKLLHQLQYIRSLTTQVVLAAADEEVAGIKQRISEIRANVKILESMVCAHASTDFRKLQDLTDHLSEENIFALDETIPNIALSLRLNDAINALQKIYRLELK